MTTLSDFGFRPTKETETLSEPANQSETEKEKETEKPANIWFLTFEDPKHGTIYDGAYDDYDKAYARGKKIFDALDRKITFAIREGRLNESMNSQNVVALGKYGLIYSR